MVSEVEAEKMLGLGVTLLGRKNRFLKYISHSLQIPNLSTILTSVVGERLD